MTELIEREKVVSPTTQAVPKVNEGGPLGGVVNSLKFALDPFVYMQHLKQTYGPLVRLEGPLTKYTFVFTPELTRQVLTDTTLFHNGELDDYPLQIPKDSALYRISRTLNAINGDRHRQQRKLMMPAFHRKRVEAYHQDMVSLIEQKSAEWAKRPSTGQPLNILQEMKQLTLAVAVKTLLGLDPDREGEATRQIVERWLIVGANPAAFLLPLNLPGLPFRQVVGLAEQVEAEFQKLVEYKRKAGPGNDVLSMLLEAHDEESGARLSNQELISQTLALFVAGHETTATALTWTLFLLSQHPAILADLVDELESSLHGAAPTLEQVNQLPLLDGVIKESMRILSPFLWGIRLTTADTELGGYRVPKDTMTVFAPAVIHHDPQIYPEPNRFKPERWQKLDPATYEYLPFAAGPRMCIGATFATLEMKLVLATLLQRYRLALAPGAKIDRAGMLLTYPRHGMPMLVYPQDYHFGKNPARGNIQAVVQLS